MLHRFFGKVAAGAIVSLAMVAWTSQAEAGWRWHGSSGGGSAGGWGGGSSGGGSSGGGWGGSSGGGWGGGSSGGGGSGGGGWGGHWHKHWHRKSWGSSGGGSGGGSSGGGSSGGGWGGSSGGGSSGGWGGSSGGGSSGGSYYYAPGVDVDPSMTVPMTPGIEAPPAPAPAPVPGQSTQNTRVDGLLAVNVPEDAKIFVNGQATTSSGAARQYVSRDLQLGFNYTYEVRAEVVRDGRTVEQVKKINLRAGQTANLAFAFSAAAAAETSLTVHVPADAKVYLAGNATKASGETRVFRTTGLSGDKSWEGYTIRVELERGGRTETKEESITLKAGQSQELSFDFGGDQVASAR